MQHGHGRGADAAEAEVGGGRATSAARSDEALVAAHLEEHHATTHGGERGAHVRGRPGQAALVEEVRVRFDGLGT